MDGMVLVAHELGDEGVVLGIRPALSLLRDPEQGLAHPHKAWFFHDLRVSLVNAQLVADSPLARLNSASSIADG